MGAAPHSDGKCENAFCCGSVGSEGGRQVTAKSNLLVPVGQEVEIRHLL